MRHKYVTTLQHDWYPLEDSAFFKDNAKASYPISIFEWMRQQGYVDDQYNYSTKDRNIGGKVFQQKIAGKTRCVIATNSTVTTYRGMGRWRKDYTYRIMYALNDTGIKWLKETLLEDNLKGE
jgi:hypothetical protein